MIFLRQILSRLWHSPTWTQWAYQAVMSLQVVLIAPLILRHFDTTQTAAWYLFASLNIFGTFVMQRMLLTFARTIAMCRGGFDWKSGSSLKMEEPNWSGINRLIPTMAGLQIALAIVSVAIALTLGLLGLKPLLENYPKSREVWTAFALFQIGSFITIYLSRYHAILMGLNALALSNRWRFLTVGIGLICVGLAIVLGFGIVAATAINQSIYLVGGLAARLSISKPSGGHVSGLEKVELDREIIRLTIAPIWKGFVNQLASVGILPMAGILIAHTGNAAMTAGFSFAARLLMAIEQVGMTPFNSIQPVISQLMVRGAKIEVHKLLVSRACLSFSLVAGGVTIMGLGLPWGLRLIDSQTAPISTAAWFFLSIAIIVGRLYYTLLAPHYAINNIVLYRRAVVHMILSLITIRFLLPYWGVEAVGLAVLGSYLLVYRLSPLKLYAEEMNYPWKRRQVVIK